jgi:DNA-binding transcriptional ArsR family regulator
LPARNDPPEVRDRKERGDGRRDSPTESMPYQGPAPIASFFRVLEDPARLRIVEFLCGSERTAQECAEYVGLPAGVVARHLNVLAASGYVTEGQSGGDRYAITSSRAAEMVLLVRSLADDNELAITTCARIDQGSQATDSCMPQAEAKDSGKGRRRTLHSI